MLLIKVGGGAAINLAGVAQDVSTMEAPMVIVHGASALRDSLAERLGVEKRILTSVSGVSSVYSDAEMVDLVLMAYAGLRNKRLVELLQQRGVHAVGLSGVDGAAVRGMRNRGIRIRVGEKTVIRRDLSGKPVAINRKLLRLLLDNAFTPVLTVPIIDERNVAINSENDDMVALLCRVLQPDWVIQLIEAPGLLADPADPGSVVSRVNRDELAEWRDRTEGRMKRKLLAIETMVATGRTGVLIADGRTKTPLADAMAGKGTVIS